MMMLKMMFAILVTYLLMGANAWAETIPFDWQKQTVQVTETRIKVNENNKQTSLKIRYPVELKNHEEGYLVDFGTVEFLELNGEKLDEGIISSLERVLGDASKRPDIVVARDGTPLEVVDWQGYLSAIGQIDADAKKAMDVLEETTELELVLYLKALTEPWCHWVCQWSDEVFSKEGSVYEYQEDGLFDMLDIKEQIENRLLDKEQDWLFVQMSTEKMLDGMVRHKDILTAKIHGGTGEPERVDFIQSKVDDGQEYLQEKISYEFEW